MLDADMICVLQVVKHNCLGAAGVYFSKKVVVPVADLGVSPNLMA